MNKLEILNQLKAQRIYKITSNILTTIENALEPNIDYQIELDSDLFKIHTTIKDGERGSYFELINGQNKETKNGYLIITKKEYSPSFIGINLFTQANSYVYDQNDRLLHRSYFSDENKNYGNNQMALSTEAFLAYFRETTPSYKNGYFVEGPRVAYQPFTDIWQRYANTNVVKHFGRNPMRGEYSNIAITFDNSLSEDINLLSESYGTVYKTDREIQVTNEKDAVSTIERIYQSCKRNDHFDLDKFNSDFEEEMFAPNHKSL